MLSKKETEQILVDVQQQQQQQQQQQHHKDEKKGFTMVSTDESFFFYDSLVRRVWIDENKRPIIRVTGSHNPGYAHVFLTSSLNSIAVKQEKIKLCYQSLQIGYCYNKHSVKC